MTERHRKCGSPSRRTARRTAALLAYAGVGLLLFGCAPQHVSDDALVAEPSPIRAGAETEPGRAADPSAALGEAREGHFAVRLTLATDRHWDDDEEAFGNERGKELRFGFCDVGIPERHKLGRIERPKIFGREKPAKHVVQFEIEHADRGALIERLKRRVLKSERREIFVFVHGGATDLEEATRRAAQIAFDVQFDGAVVVYSWPTEGRVLRYSVDETNAQWTQPHLEQFLTLLTREAGAQRVHVMAHSLGNRLLTRALKELVRKRPENSDPMFDQIVLAAADMDVEIFERDLAPFLVRAAQRVTVYVSDRDRALLASRKLHKYPRVGQAKRADSGAVRPNRVDVVDVSDVTRGMVGHDYYGDAPLVLEDLRRALRGDSPADRGLRKVDQLYYLDRP